MKKLFFKLSIMLIIMAPTILSSETSQNRNILDKIKSGIRAGTNLILSSGDVSQENNIYAKELFKRVDTEDELPSVKKMNKVMEYLLGYKNTIALPIINQIYVNEKWIDRLPEEQKRFVLGRAIGWLKNGKTYLAAQLLGNGCLIFLNNKQNSANEVLVKKLKTASNDKKILMALNAQKENTPNALLIFLIGLASIYTNRAIAYNADEYAIKKFDCINGAIPLIEDLQLYESDNSSLGRMFAYWPIAYWAPTILNQINLSGISNALHAIDFVPGRIHNTPSELGYKFKSLPVVNYFSRYPGVQSRTIALKKQLDK